VWLIDEAVRQGAAWTREGRAVIVGINVSPRQLQHADLVATFARALRRHDIRGEHFIIELTETALQCEPAHAQDVMLRLRELGVASAVDDFGADYSSLSRLRELPLQMFKLDRSFLRDVPGDRRARELVKAIVGVGRALDLRTVVEGVETQEQGAFLAEAGADLLQGFWLGRPQPPELAREHLTRFEAWEAPKRAVRTS
jgi:diguanylate cyclase